MFCPNCGAENESNKAPCGQCGFKLSGVSASKFKGTMMLNSNDEVQALLKAHKEKQQAADADAGAGAGTSAKIPRPPAGVPRAPKRLGGTMLGVAPQAGGVVPPGPGQFAPAEAAPEPGKTLASTPPSPQQPAPRPHSVPPPNADSSSGNAREAAAPIRAPQDSTQISPSAPSTNAAMSADASADLGATPPPVVSDLDLARPVPESEKPIRSASETRDPAPMALSEPELRSLVSPGAKRQAPSAAMTGVEWFLCFVTLGLYALVRWMRTERT